ncbi:MAG: hypothetical protein D6701_11830 [Gemmatimonadetes bacterium]|nr:MAG: hypothetical protein D6701_11830 [Gemmatimonadota bacterium]
MARESQRFENHTKMVPGFHYVGSALLVVLLVWALWRLVTDPSLDHGMMLLLVVFLALLGWYVRIFPLGVQDRVIRLEERLRMERVLPDELRPRIAEFTTSQLIALRFAPDDELPDLARRVLAGELHGRTEIKRAIRTWRADHERI